MKRRFVFVMLMGLVLAVPFGGVALAATPELNLPPGIQRQAEPLIAEIMARMESMGMSIGHAGAHLQLLAEQVPPGIFLQLLTVMVQLERADMMVVLAEYSHPFGKCSAPPFCGSIIACDY